MNHYPTCTESSSYSQPLLDYGHISPQEINDELVCLEGDEEYQCLAYGDVTQIWRRKMQSTGRIVAIKEFRMVSTDGVGDINRNFEIALVKLVGEWRTLKHQNIMPCLGITLKHGLVASLVIPMCPEGSINQYVEEHPNENKLALLSQVAGGIAYLHAQGVVHGRIRGNNILIAPNGRPLITDTGLSQVIQAQAGIFPWRGASESVRWNAPELFPKFDSELDDAAAEPADACACTASSDVWALGMTILEVMSGWMPYSRPKRMLYMVGFAIMDGILPQRPDGGTVSDELWDLLNVMWARSPGDRPSASFVQSQLDALQSSDSHYLNLHKL